MRITRRSRFALPLVLVVGCGSSPKTSTTPPEGAPTLPPAPGSGAVTKTTTDNGHTLLTYESGDRVYVHKDGTCHAEYNANCDSSGPEEPSTCNPPPPQQVQCPPDVK